MLETKQITNPFAYGPAINEGISWMHGSKFGVQYENSEAEKKNGEEFL